MTLRDRIRDWHRFDRIPRWQLEHLANELHEQALRAEASARADRQTAAAMLARRATQHRHNAAATRRLTQDSLHADLEDQLADELDHAATMLTTKEDV